MINLQQTELNNFYLTLSENLDESIFATYSENQCNLFLDYSFNFYDKNTLLTDTFVLTDTSLSPNRYNQFELDLQGVTSSFSTVGIYTYEVYYYDGVGATGSCLEKGLCRVNGEQYPVQYTREIDDNSIYIRKNT